MTLVLLATWLGLAVASFCVVRDAVLVQAPASASVKLLLFLFVTLMQLVWAFSTLVVLVVSLETLRPDVMKLMSVCTLA